MTARSFSTFTEASTFARKIALECSATVSVLRRGAEFVVESGVSFAPAETQQSERRQTISTPPPNQITSVSSARIAHLAPAPVAPKRAKKWKKKPVGLSAAAAKRTSSKNGERIYDPRSKFIMDSIEPKVISGGLPSLGKRK